MPACLPLTGGIYELTSKNSQWSCTLTNSEDNIFPLFKPMLMHQQYLHKLCQPLELPKESTHKSIKKHIIVAEVTIKYMAEHCATGCIYLETQLYKCNKDI